MGDGLIELTGRPQPALRAAGALARLRLRSQREERMSLSLGARVGLTCPKD